jgi:type VI secretion system protein ImpA
MTAFRYEIENLLVPISPDSPSGEYLLYEGAYDRIKDARREDDVSLERGVWKHTLKRADWSAVESLCIQTLEEHSKDLQIAGWLLEAWLQLHGFAGLREGFRLIAALSDTFWDDIHPRIEGSDLEYRIAPIVWLNEKVPTSLKLVPVTKPESGDVRPYCWADWELACRPDSGPVTPAPGTRATAKEDKITQGKFQQSALLTPSATLVEIVHDLEHAMESCSDLEALLDKKCQGESPSLRQLSGTLEPIHGLLLSLLNQRDIDPSAEPANGGAALESLDTESFDSASASSEGPVRNRADAYRRLAEAAEYLLRTEPHSPSPYLVKRAIAWGSMSLEELLPHLVRNNGELVDIFRLLQIGKQ